MQLVPITADDESEARDEVLGTIGIWKIDWKCPQTWEMGWFVLPEHQRRGVASEAARLLLSQARVISEVRYVHAFPTITNAASNAIARKISTTCPCEQRKP